MKTLTLLLDELVRKIEMGDEASGTVRLFREGHESVLVKLVEESAEIWMAIRFESKEALALEISQYWYYLLLTGLLIDPAGWKAEVVTLQDLPFEREPADKVTPKFLVQETARVAIRHPKTSLTDLKQLYRLSRLIMEKHNLPVNRVNAHL